MMSTWPASRDAPASPHSPRSSRPPAPPRRAHCHGADDRKDRCDKPGINFSVKQYDGMRYIWRTLSDFFLKERHFSATEWHLQLIFLLHTAGKYTPYFYFQSVWLNDPNEKYDIPLLITNYTMNIAAKFLLTELWCLCCENCVLLRQWPLTFLSFDFSNVNTYRLSSAT